MSRDTLTQILNLARWAPSGDNTQPWRFEILDDQSVRVHGFDTRDHVLYDYRGHASHIAHGALLETIRIASTGFGLDVAWRINSDGTEDRHPTYDVRFTPNSLLSRDPLFPFIESRTVQRRPMRTRPLSDQQRTSLIEAAGSGFSVQLFESIWDRAKVARMLWNSAGIRLTCPEAYPVHKEIIEWRAQFSDDRIPEGAVGVDPLTARLMEWVMQSWSRVHFFNRFLFGTIAPRIQLDLLPALFCSSHLLVRPLSPPKALEDWVSLGITVQRIWLTATQCELHLQPQMTPIIFRWYARAGDRFSSKLRHVDDAIRVADQIERIADGNATDNFGFFARVGVSQHPSSRSLRMDLNKLTNPLDGTPPT